ncbi:LamG domain-containing protein [Catellatospora vulcania]|uniref:LamG domain-containing protein n=1 Tax=Catellatospora vulcania TaxID=1460450 RepID=UPI0012D3FD04|nr:LamG domain-containing protein [Catellatospora vulcania]
MSRLTALATGLGTAVVVLAAAVVLLWPAQSPPPVEAAVPAPGAAVEFTVDGHDVATADCPKGVDWVDDPVHGQVIMLNGADQFCLTGGPLIRTTGDYSVSAWVKLFVPPDGLAMTAVAQDGVHASGFYLQYSWYHRKWAFNWMEADVVDPVHNRTSTSDEPVTTEWTHLVGTYEARTRQITLYVNGVPGKPETIGKPWQAKGPLTIGRARWNGQPGNGLRGQIAGVQVWTRTLKPEEVVEVRDAATRAS